MSRRSVFVPALVVVALLALGGPAAAALLFADDTFTLVNESGLGSNLPGMTVSRDDTASDTLYFRFDLPDIRSDYTDESYFAALQLFEGGSERLGVGNAFGPFAYSAFNSASGDVDLNSARTDWGAPWQLVRESDATTIVFRVDYAAGGDDAVTVWLDPDPTLPEASQPANLTTRFDANASFDEIRLREGGGGAGGAGWGFADIRVGTRFADALPGRVQVAGWDFSQYATAGRLTLDGTTYATQLAANYSSFDLTNGAGAEAAGFGVLYLDGSFGSTSVSATPPSDVAPTPRAVVAGLTSNAGGAVQGNKAGVGRPDFDAFSTLAAEGQASTQLLALRASQPATLAFRGDLAMAPATGNAPILGARWAVSFGGETLAGSATVTARLDAGCDGSVEASAGPISLDTNTGGLARAARFGGLNVASEACVLLDLAAGAVVDNVSLEAIPYAALSLYGTGQGGSVSILIDGEGLIANTTPGQSAASVLADLAAQIESNPALEAAGIVVEIEGNVLVTSGDLSFTIADAGLTTEPLPVPVPALGPIAAWLLSLGLIGSAVLALRRKGLRSA